jgi:hypothetical protein
MKAYRLHRISCIALCAIAGVFASTTGARAQGDPGTQAQAEVLAAAAKANRELAEGLAKELGSTPEQAAGAAGVVFGIAKSFLKPEEFAQVAKAVPGMDALLAVAPTGVVGNPTALAATPGFATSSSTPGVTMAAPDGMAWAGLSKLGIKPEMIAKAVPFLSGYLKKYGGAAVGGLLGGLFKTGK